jgi:glycosyltransferase involved in cell wall biosynthesis
MAAPAIWAASIRGKRVIVNYRGGDAPRFFSRSFWLVQPTLRRASAVVVPSRFLADVFGKFGVRTHVVPNIVDLERFQAAPRPVGDVHLIVTRNLEPIYDVGTAIRAFALVRARFPNARMTVAGTGPELQNLRGLAAACGAAGAVSFAGRIDNREIPALYQSASLMLNPSTVDNMPISILEAWSSGVPVVTTNAGGIPYLVEAGRDALLVDPRQPEDMAAAAIRVLETPTLAAALAKRGREVVGEFSWKRVRGKWLEVYDAVASDHRVPGSEVIGG